MMLRINGMPDGDEGRPLPAKFREYRKTALTRACKMDVEFEVKTLEGVMRGKAGDYLCVGPAGEAYPCDASIFEETYVPAGVEGMGG